VTEGTYHLTEFRTGGGFALCASLLDHVDKSGFLLLRQKGRPSIGTDCSSAVHAGLSTLQSSETDPADLGGLSASTPCLPPKHDCSLRRGVTTILTHHYYPPQIRQIGALRASGTAGHSGSKRTLCRVKFLFRVKLTTLSKARTDTTEDSLCRKK